MKTYRAQEKSIERKFYLVDANGVTLGKLATKVATILRGKHKPYYSPDMDTGDFVIVINSSKVGVTGKKEKNKIYYWHTGYPHGFRKRTLEEMRTKNPNKIIINAVKGMLPHNKLGRKLIKKLKVYPNSKHPHSAQKPTIIKI